MSRKIWILGVMQSVNVITHRDPWRNGMNRVVGGADLGASLSVTHSLERQLGFQKTQIDRFYCVEVWRGTGNLYKQDTVI